MSDQPPRDDDPTRANPPLDDAAGEPTRLERPIPSYDPDREPATGPVGGPVLDRDRVTDRSIVAPLVTTGLVCILLGIGIGWVLFGDSDNDAADETTTTSSSTTTETTDAPTTSIATTTTEARRTTTTVDTTDTSTETQSSSTVRDNTTTTAAPG